MERVEEPYPSQSSTTAVGANRFSEPTTHHGAQDQRSSNSLVILLHEGAALFPLVVHLTGTFDSLSLQQLGVQVTLCGL